MIRRLILPLLFVCSAANAQFTPGQILTAAQLNSALAAKTSNSAAAITGGSITNASITGGTMSGTAITGGTISGLTSPLPVASGGTGATASTGSGSVVLATSPTIASPTITGSFTAPGLISPGSLAAQAANTVLANVTASSASPTAVAIPSCSTSNSAVQYTSGTGLSCGTSFALTNGTLAQFASTTSAQLAGVLSDETGSGSAVFGTSPTLSAPTISGGTVTNAPISGSTGSFTTLAASSAVSGAGFSTYLASPPAIGTTTPAAGKFTTLQATSTITPSSTGGIVGTTTNDSANAGSVGEYITASATSVAITTGVVTNITSISLTAGDWDVSGVVQFSPAAGTVVGSEDISISTTSATTGGLGTRTFIGATKAIGQADIVPTPVVRISVASTTTVYLVGAVAYSTSTLTVSGLIRARRIR